MYIYTTPFVTERCDSVFHASRLITASLRDYPNCVFVVSGDDKAGYAVEGFHPDEEPTSISPLIQFADNRIETTLRQAPCAFVAIHGRMRFFGENLHHGVSSVLLSRLKTLLGHQGRK